jgi:glutamyl/glutaminyl-tRNA synthetase
VFAVTPPAGPADDNHLVADPDAYRKTAKAHSELTEIVTRYREWKQATSHASEARLMLEDTDAERSTESSIDHILEDLQWLGIRWDEGPDRGGSAGPYRQSQRLSIYREFADRLCQEGKAYKCFCSEERLENLRKEQLSKGTMPRYDGRCRSLSAEEIAKMDLPASALSSDFVLEKERFFLKTSFTER